jgi:hypothetical protein
MNFSETRERDELLAKVDRLEKWVADLQDGRYVICAYCGHCYGPKGDAALADVLKRHIAACPEHPMSRLVQLCREAYEALGNPAPNFRQAQPLLHALHDALKEFEPPTTNH